MDDGEDTRVGRVDENADEGRLQTPTVRLRRTAEFTPTRVRISAVGHPQHWGRFRPSGTGAEGQLH